MAKKIGDVLDRADEYLKKHEVRKPRLDAEVLLADLINTERIKLYVNFDYPLTKKQLEAYRSRLKRRAKGVPVSYITGSVDFMSLEFKIRPGVLIPRPETEELVENILGFCRDRGWSEPRIADLGTGCGAIMISLLRYLPESRAVGTDVEEEAVELARENIKKHELGERAAALTGSWAEPLLPEKEGELDIVVSNPPYIASGEMEDLPRRVKEEPRRALEAGPDGLKCYRELIPQGENLLREDGLLALEIGREQGEDIISLLEKEDGWHSLEIKQDGTGRDRFVFARLEYLDPEERGKEDGN